jgi:hypothetical protein
MTADLSGVDAKIGWAKRHLAELTRTIGDTLEAHPYRFVGQMDADSGEYVLTVHDLPAMDPTWSLRVGDVVHNLRSGLDHLAWQLVILDDRRPDVNTQFPIRRSAVDKNGQPVPIQLRPTVRNREILDALEAVQPYLGPEGEPAEYARNPLWRLHRLDIIDKHRLLLVVRAALDVGHVWWWWWGEDPPPANVFLNTSPLDEGDVVARFDVGGREPPPDWDVHPDISIVLHEPAVLDMAHVGVVGVLNNLVWWVEEHIVNWRFRPLFRRSAEA